ncbi:MAG: 4-phosphopantoate--beta-alanine ligase [Candidatus Hodarchaeota archaeon]
MTSRFEISNKHPRAESLRIRELLVDFWEKGIVTTTGLIAHGRGEAFDYLLGEETTHTAREAMKASAASLLLADCPVFSVNGNVAALVAKEIVELSRITGANIEVNLFHRSRRREESIKKLLENAGAKGVLGVGPAASKRIPEIDSERRRVDPEGIYVADVVLVPLEDGDRTEGLVKMGKTVIAIDLNPLSRTAQFASITIVDNVVRVMPALIRKVKELKSKNRAELTKIVTQYSNRQVLSRVINQINTRLKKLSEKGIYLEIPPQAR